MALINCPECGKEVSDKATVCPSCAFPLVKQQQHVVTSTAAEQTLAFPDLPADLNIGKQITNWGQDSYFKGDYLRDENVIGNLDSGKINVMLHTHGITLSTSLTHRVEIHNAQIISLNVKTRVELVSADKSVIGRAVVGGLVFGGVGAIVGGLSGINKSEKITDKTYLIINYWDVKTHSPQTILIGGDKKLITNFINRYQKESALNESGRTAEKEKNTAGKVMMIILLLVAVFIVYLIFN